MPVLPVIPVRTGTGGRAGKHGDEFTMYRFTFTFCCRGFTPRGPALYFNSVAWCDSVTVSCR